MHCPLSVLLLATLAAAGVSDIRPVRHFVGVRSLGTLLEPLPDTGHNATTLWARDDLEPAYSIPGTQWLAIQGYHWDELTGDKYPHRERVIDAWHTAKDMAKAARDNIKELTPAELAARGEEAQKLHTGKRKLLLNQKKNVVRSWIAKQFPAYTQMFAAAIDYTGDWDGPQLIHNRLTKLIDNMEDLNAVGRPRTDIPDEEEENWRRNGMKLYLTRHESPTDSEGVDQCSGGTEAFVQQVGEIREFAAARPAGASEPADHAWVINFCKPFFERPVTSELLKALKDGKKSKQEVCNLATHDSTARILLHELTHIGWILNLRPADGYDVIDLRMVALHALSSQTGASDTAKPQVTSMLKGEKGSPEISDAYARFGVYAYLNALEECKGIRWTGPKHYEAECTDVWPPDVRKVTFNKWKTYKKK